MGKKLYVGNLPYSIDEETLKTTFSQNGTVESVKIITDRDTGRSKGFAFVEMSTDEEAASCISKLNGTQCGVRAMTVSGAKPMVPRDKGGFGGGRGGRSDRGGFGGRRF